MQQLWTVYNNRLNEPYLAIKSEVGKPDDFGLRSMASSDLIALRSRLAQLGLSRLPPDREDPSVILEVWTG
jgi:hypothetical protein